MHFKNFGPFVVYWKEADILGPARLTFNASSFHIRHDDDYPSLSQINDDLLAATDFFLSKKIELLLTDDKKAV